MINNGMYIVEILRGGEDLLYEMDEMNRWMDQHVRAPKIQFYWAAEILVFRVTFNTVTGATAFARAFEGRLLDPRTPEPDAFAPRRYRVLRPARVLSPCGNGDPKRRRRHPPP